MSQFALCIEGAEMHHGRAHLHGAEKRDGMIGNVRQIERERASPAETAPRKDPCGILRKGVKLFEAQVDAAKFDCRSPSEVGGSLVEEVGKIRGLDGNVPNSVRGV